MSATASASASAAPAPATDITEIRIALPQEGDVIYLQIKHPNARAADVLNRELKAAADKRVSEAKTHGEPGVRFMTHCEGGFPSEDVLWEKCTSGSYREGARCPWSVLTNRVWSLAGARCIPWSARQPGELRPALEQADGRQSSGQIPIVPPTHVRSRL